MSSSISCDAEELDKQEEEEEESEQSVFEPEFPQCAKSWRGIIRHLI
jgi:hypothetical protein